MHLEEEIKVLIKEKLTDALVTTYDLTGGGDHIGVRVVSDHFVEKTLLEQHKIVMSILKLKFNENLHAIKLKTMTFEKYNNQEKK